MKKFLLGFFAIVAILNSVGGVAFADASYWKEYSPEVCEQDASSGSILRDINRCGGLKNGVEISDSDFDYGYNHYNSSSGTTFDWPGIANVPRGSCGILFYCIEANKPESWRGVNIELVLEYDGVEFYDSAENIEFLKRNTFGFPFSLRGRDAVSGADIVVDIDYNKAVEFSPKRVWINFDYMGEKVREFAKKTHDENAFIAIHDFTTDTYWDASVDFVWSGEGFDYRRNPNDISGYYGIRYSGYSKGECPFHDSGTECGSSRWNVGSGLNYVKNGVISLDIKSGDRPEVDCGIISAQLGYAKELCEVVKSDVASAVADGRGSAEVIISYGENFHPRGLRNLPDQYRDYFETIEYDYRYFIKIPVNINILEDGSSFAVGEIPQAPNTGFENGKIAILAAGLALAGSATAFALRKR